MIVFLEFVDLFICGFVIYQYKYKWKWKGREGRATEIGYKCIADCNIMFSDVFTYLSLLVLLVLCGWFYILLLLLLFLFSFLNFRLQLLHHQINLININILITPILNFLEPTINLSLFLFNFHVLLQNIIKF